LEEEKDSRNYEIKASNIFQSTFEQEGEPRKAT